MKHHTTMVDAFNFVESVDVNSIKDSKNIRCIEEEIIISKRKVISTMMQDVNFLINNVNSIYEVNLKQYNKNKKNNVSFTKVFFHNRQQKTVCFFDKDEEWADRKLSKSLLRFQSLTKNQERVEKLF